MGGPLAVFEIIVILSLTQETKFGFLVQLSMFNELQKKCLHR